MIKTIKTKKQMRLDELIKYIFDNGIEDTSFPASEIAPFDQCEARVSGSGNIKTSGYINEHTTFTVEVEEEITKDTRFKDVQEIYIDAEGVLEVEHHPILARKSINDVLEEHDEETKCLYIYAAVDGKTELIYERNEETINA